MKNYFLYTLITLMLTSCSSLINRESNKNQEFATTIFNKGVTVFEMVEELSIDWELKQLDTLQEKEKIKYVVLTNQREEILEFAIEQFKKVVEEYPNSKLYYKSLYNLAHLNSLMEYEEDEVKYLVMILNSNANDKENSGRSGLMVNPYANFKSDATKRLTEIYINNGNYKKALEYKKMNEKYPMQHFCGNAFAAEEIYNAIQYAKIYIGSKEHKKALNYLLPHIFNNGLANNSDVVDLAIETLYKNVDQAVLKEDLEKSINNLYAKIEKEGDDEWTNYYIKYVDIEIKIPSWNMAFETDINKVKTNLEKVIRESAFYKKLNNKITQTTL